VDGRRGHAGRFGGIRNAKARDELGWAPKYPTYADGLPVALAALQHPAR